MLELLMYLTGAILKYSSGKQYSNILEHEIVEKGDYPMTVCSVFFSACYYLRSAVLLRFVFFFGFFQYYYSVWFFNTVHCT